MKHVHRPHKWLSVQLTVICGSLVVCWPQCMQYVGECECVHVSTILWCSGEWCVVW